MDPKSSVLPGDLLAAKYRVERVIGQGGMGMVAAAVHEQLGQKVALKFLLPEMLENREVAARFLREAQAAVRIQSEHVVRVLDVGTLETGAPYIVMEYLEGSDLSHVLRDRGPLPVAEAVDCIVQACHAVSEGHRLGIVHRDLKPANMFLTTRTDGSSLVKVLDFGIAKAKLGVITGQEASQTVAHSMMGSPAYMSPEQIQDASTVDARTDVWAIGVSLYELLTGEGPFRGSTVHEFLWAIMTSQPPSLRTKRPDIPAELDAVVERCLKKAPGERIQSVAELAAALAPFAPPASHAIIERIVRAASRDPQTSRPSIASTSNPGSTVLL
ncbi:MAG TPA: serine/threonine-protein kinase, partial [Polyangiaceae bacterium]|nr:serine/threonine-protein kinase [Polyangiaceae bacterium]